jgi:hypothetical protein
MKMKVVAFCSLAFFAAGTPAQDKPRPENAPKFAVGDRWVYKEADIGNNKEPFTYANEVKEANDEIAWLYGTQGSREFWWKYDVKRAIFIERRQFSAEAADTRGKVAYSRHEKQDIRIQFPLEVGKSYPVKEYWSNSDGTSGDNDLKVTVESYEKVKTAAGEFDAYRISSKGWWNKRIDPRYPNFRGGAGQIEFVDWYAPAVKRVIKYEQKDYWQNQPSKHITGELVEFKVSP